MVPTIRPSTEADLPAITAIYAHAVTHGTASFELEPPDEAEMGRRHDSLVGDDFPYLVAEHDGRLLGYAYAGPYRTRPAYRATVEDSIYVAPDAQGAGIGQALLTALLAACTARGYRLIVAVIGDRESRGSVRLHEKAGFTHAGALEPVGYKHGRWLATLLMQKVLGEGAATPPSIPVSSGPP